MKQILQSLRTGRAEVADVPCPQSQAGHVLIRSSRSLVSSGTERMLLEFGKAGWINKARQQPDRVKGVLEKIRTDGLMPTVEAVLNKLDQPLPLGYCNVGVAMASDSAATGIGIGDRVVSNGKHAEVVSVPGNLCARVPEAVSDDEAAFTVLSAIALQGIRLAQPTLGEAVVVTGLGLIGLVTVQLLRAHGCRVLGIDVVPARLAMARQFGAEVVDLSRQEDPVAAARVFSRGRGVDAVLITASTQSNEPVHQAAVMCRKRGRIVLVGTAGLELSRADFFEKELTFQVSCSYGPGRYDPTYEDKGIDYPVGFVRWTEQRNFEAVLDMMADGRLDVKPLISHRFPIENAEQAYELIANSSPSLGILLQYGQSASTAGIGEATIINLSPAPRAGTASGVVTAFVGAGNYATAILIPAFKSAGVMLKSVASRNGLSSAYAARKFGFAQATTDADSVYSDPEVNIVVVATRHDSHARLAEQALAAGKHTFVEKPLALSHDHLDRLAAAHAASRAAGRAPLLMVGFNRRFAPHVRKMHTLLAGVKEPKVFVMTINAGAIAASHWTQEPNAGGGRIVGEACHFVDLLRFMAGSPITAFHAASIGRTDGAAVTDDKATIILRFADGSMGTILYLANGHKSFPKERLEVFAAGRILKLDNFRKLTGFGWPGSANMNLWRQDKGQKACVAAFVQAVESGGPSPIPLDELLEVGHITLDIADALSNQAQG